MLGVDQRWGALGAGESWRGLHWAPPLLAIIITLEVASGGANDWVSRPVAALGNIAASCAILLATDDRSRVWTRMRRPVACFVAALAWGAVPRWLPAAGAALIGVPPDPALDRLWPALADSVSRLGLVLAGCAAGYRLKKARPFVSWFAASSAVYIGVLLATPSPWRHLVGGGVGRYAATIGNWNAAGAYFGMNAALCLAALLSDSDGYARWWRGFFALPLAGAIMLCMATASRSAFTLTSMALAFGLIWNWRSASFQERKHRGPVLIALTLAAVMAAAWVGTNALFPRYLMLSEDGISRWKILTIYAGYTMESPIWGFGPGSFFEVNQARLTSSTAAHFWDFGAAHNAALQIALEYGWPALLLLIAGVANIARDVFRRAWNAEDVGLLGALAIASGASFVDIAWNVPAVGALSCVLLGVLWGVRPAGVRRLQIMRRSSTGKASGVPVTN